MDRPGSIASLMLGAILWIAAAQLSTAQPRPPVPRISQEVRQQLESLRAEKAARSPAQRKISSRLLYAWKMRRGLAIAPGVARLRSGVEVDSDGTTLGTSVRTRARPCWTGSARSAER